MDLKDLHPHLWSQVLCFRLNRESLTYSHFLRPYLTSQEAVTAFINGKRQAAVLAERLGNLPAKVVAGKPSRIVAGSGHETPQ
jgi:hypothetical protein